MATIKTTLIKKMDDETNNIYPKTSADVVEYGDTTVSAVLDAVVNSEDLEASEQRILTAIEDISVTGSVTTEDLEASEQRIVEAIGTIDIGDSLEDVVKTEDLGTAEQNIIDAINSTYAADDFDALITGTITEVNNDKITTLRPNAFANCESLTTAILPNITSISGSAFNSCASLSTVDFSNVESVEGYGLYGCSSLIKVCFPKLTRIETKSFSNCSDMLCLIILSPEVATLVSSDAFSSSGISRGSGYVYVPDDLVESYKSANNWSGYSGKIKGLSELPSEYDSLLLTTGSADLDFILGGES